MVLAACTGGGRLKPSPTPTPTPHRGGEAVFGYQLGAECLNPITECASVDYAHRIVFHQVLPGAMQLDSSGNFVASPLLVEAPSLGNGGLTQNPFTVRFRIAPAAVWEDGSPITSSDFAFTWRAILSTKFRGVPVAYRAAAYRHILRVDSQDPTTAIVRFDAVDVDWPDFFGGAFDYVVKAAAFPKADPNAPNLRKEMLDSIPFSGGPFRLESWTADRTVLVRNERFFGKKALLDLVTFVRLLPNEEPFDALARGKISAIDPAGSWAAPPGQSPPRLRNIAILTSDGTGYEALWFNQRVAPLDDPQVREALMFALDRRAVIDALV